MEEESEPDEEDNKPPFSPPSSSEKQREVGSRRKRNLTFTKEDSCGNSPTIDVSSQPPSTKRRRRSTYDSPSHENSFGTSLGLASGERGMELSGGHGMELDAEHVEPIGGDGGCHSDGDTKNQILNLLEKRVEERSKNSRLFLYVTSVVNL